MDGEAEAKDVNEIKPRIITVHAFSEKLAMEKSQVIINTVML